MKNIYEYIAESINKINWSLVADKVFPAKDRENLFKDLNIPSDVKILVDGTSPRRNPIGKWTRVTIDPFYTDPTFIALDITARWNTADEANIWFDKLDGKMHRGFVYIDSKNLNGAYPTDLIVEINRGAGAMSACNFIRLILDYSDEQVLNTVKELYPKINGVQDIM